MKTFEICPICGKKGLSEESGSRFYRHKTCRYCKAGWATHKWTAVTHHNTDTCPNCGYESVFKDAVYPHFEPLNPAMIKRRIEHQKASYAKKPRQ